MKHDKSQKELQERVKELDCLYSMSKLVETPGADLDSILQGTVGVLPRAWQYPEVACARLLLRERTYTSPGFHETKWRQSAKVKVHDVEEGNLCVFYLKERPDSHEGPFLHEERNLLDAVAARLGRIIEHSRAEAALRESESRFRELVENSAAGVFIIHDDRVAYENPEQRSMDPTLASKLARGEMDDLHPDDIRRVEEGMTNLRHGDTSRSAFSFRFFQEGRKNDPEALRWVYCRAGAIEYMGHDAIIVELLDVTRSKQMENMLVMQDKMTSLGRVAAGIAHEIRNPLSGVNIYMDTLEKRCREHEGTEEMVEIIGHVKSASTRIEGVVKRVLDFSKPGEPRLVQTDVNTSVREALDLGSVTLRKQGITLVERIADDLPICLLDPQMFVQVVLNLLMNATQALASSEGDRTVRVTTQVRDDCVVISVEDSGPGVPANNREKIFDPFFTTKHDNTGIGLSITRRIVDDHGGSITVEQSDLGGAAFVVRLVTANSLDQRGGE